MGQLVVSVATDGYTVRLCGGVHEFCPRHARATLAMDSVAWQPPTAPMLTSPHVAAVASPNEATVMD